LQTAIDQGGPRKEFFSLILSAIKEKYFDKGFREFMSADYIVIGKIIGGHIIELRNFFKEILKYMYVILPKLIAF
jgi:hypothetical protein